MKKLWKKKMFRRYLSFILVLCIGTSLYIPLAAEEVQEEDVNISMEGAPRLNYTAVTEDGIVAGNEQLQELMEEYFSLREKTMAGNMKETVVARKVSALAKSEEVRQKEAARSEGVDNLATYHGVHVQEWTNHFYIENEELLPVTAATGTEALKLNIYEWNWVVYDDGKGGPKDEMGFATIHEMTLEKEAGGRYCIAADIYDESNLLGRKDKTFEEIAREAAYERAEKIMEAQTIAKELSQVSTISKIVNNSIKVNEKQYYHPVEAIIYADRYVNHTADGSYGYCGSYNSDYKSYATPDTPTYRGGGNDCANYVSQCLKAGGMVFESGASGWWYNSNGDDPNTLTHTNSASWSGTLSMESYWVTKKGYQKVRATTNTMYPGNPVIGNSGGHVGICVGYNASGVPIINAHTADEYHVPYTGWVDYTIQIVQNNTGKPKPSSATSITPTTVKQMKIATVEKDGWYYFKFTVNVSAGQYATYTFSGESTAASKDFCANMCIYRQVSTSNGRIYMDEVKRVLSSSLTTTRFSTSIRLTAGTYYIQIYALNPVYSSGSVNFYYQLL